MIKHSEGCGNGLAQVGPLLNARIKQKRYSEKFELFELGGYVEQGGTGGGGGSLAQERARLIFTHNFQQVQRPGQRQNSRPGIQIMLTVSGH